MRASRSSGPDFFGLIVAGLMVGAVLNPANASAAEGATAPATAKAAPAKPAPAVQTAAAPASVPAAQAPTTSASAPAKSAPTSAAPVAKAPAPAVSAPAPANAATAPAAPNRATQVAPAKAAPAAAPAKGVPASNVSKTGPAPQVAAAPAKPGAKPVRTAPSGGALARVSTPTQASKSGLVQQAAALDEHVTYQYNALGRRDPFQSMLNGEFVGADVGGDAPVDVGGLKVVGIMWGASDKFALAEDGKGNSLVLRVGDKVMHGVVEEMQREAVVVKLTVDGQTQSVAIPLTRKGDRNNASR